MNARNKKSYMTDSHEDRPSGTRFDQWFMRTILYEINSIDKKI